MLDKTSQLKSIIELLSASVTKGEVMSAFQTLAQYVQGIQRANENEWSLIKSAVSVLGEKLKEANAKDVADAKNSLSVDIAKALKEQEQGMKFIYDKVASLQNGEDGEDGRTPTEEELLALITPLIPQVENGKDAEIDMAAIIAEVKKTIPTQERVGWGAHPLAIAQSGTIKEKVARHINFTGATVTRSPTGVVTVAIGGGTSVYDEVVAGNTNTFTLAHVPTAGTVRVYALGQRLVPTTDWTISGAIITTVSAWSAGQIIADYGY